MKEVQHEIVHIFPFFTFSNIFRWTPRVTVNISLVYFSISAIIRKDIDGMPLSSKQMTNSRPSKAKYLDRGN